jgi:glycosyltransferase involved in cell wall biosynthesis
MKILVIVPAYNEEENVGRVISDLKENFSEGEVLVIDDGSYDRTAEIAKSAGVKVLCHPFNLGIGGAVQTGYRYGVLYNYDVAIQFDGDGQHFASEIKKILSPILNNEADVVIGSRFLVPENYRAPFFRRLGIAFFSSLLKLTVGVNVKDPTSGFRAINKRAMMFFYERYPEDYPEVESIVLLKKKGFRIREVPVRMKQREGGKSSITLFASIYYMIKVSLAILIDLLKRR